MPLRVPPWIKYVAVRRCLPPRPSIVNDGGLFEGIIDWFANAQPAFPFILLAISVIAEAALSFLGLGPSGLDYSSWGLMLAEGKNYLAVAWWAATIPGLAIMTAVLSINIVGDWLRDRLDPKLQT